MLDRNPAETDSPVRPTPAPSIEAARVPFVALDRENHRLADELRSAFERVLAASAFVLGEEVERFEHAWAGMCGTRHCVTVASGTAALTLLIQAAGIRPGEEVIVPAHTFYATGAAVLATGAIPVACDVDADTGLLDLASAEEVVTERTAALLPVHLYGQLVDLDAFAAFADRHGLLLLEDAAHAHGAQRGGLHPGARGAGAAFSFYPSKNLGALGDGGAICTNDAALAERARRLRNLGQRAKGEHVELAGNERLHGLQAAFLGVKARHLEASNADRRRHAGNYRARLEGCVDLLREVEPHSCVYHVFPVRVPARDRVADHLRRAGIDVAVHYSPALHQHEGLRDLLGVRTPLPNAEAWAATELSLPLSPCLTDAEVTRAAEACLSAVASVGGGRVHAVR